MFNRWLLQCWIAPLLLALTPVSIASAEHGVLAAFSQDTNTDIAVLPNLSLFVPKSEAPSAFLQPGRFSVELVAFLSIELRGQYLFRLQASGHTELIINGTAILDFPGTGGMSDPTQPVRLNRGTNAVAIRFSSPPQGDAHFQLLWAPKNSTEFSPVRDDFLNYDRENPRLEQFSLRRRGFWSFLEYRCGKCHQGPTGTAPELDLDAPDFSGIGSRLNASWMADWIADPQRLFRGSHMPALFASRSAAAGNARAIAAYLSTLNAETPTGEPQGQTIRGAALFRELRCSVCHDENDSRINNAAAKFAPRALSSYLLNPAAHYRLNPMPGFKLSPGEAADLASWLNSKATKMESKAESWPQPEQGKALVQTSGCLNCHASQLPNKFSAPPLATIAQSLDRGCLNPGPESKAPRFDLNPETKAALTAFLKAAEFSSLNSVVPHEFAARQLDRLRCTECHEKSEGAPRVALLGAKLNPQWSEEFIKGSIPYKPRPWLPSRMPTFPAYAGTVARGLASLHGLAPVPPAAPPVDTALAAIGARLVSTAGGFSCVACHAVGSFSGGQVVETPGVNLSYSGERLLKSFFHRWVINPLAIDPTSKMPVYFDAEGRSQLTEFFEGNGKQQIDAIWEYLRLGSKMPPPPVP